MLVPADKASNNIIVICKKYYLDIVLKELKQDMGTDNVYKLSELIQEDIVSRHLVYIKSETINVNPVMHKIPSMYWLPKMHKTPIGSRIIAASSCTTKPLSKLLTRCLSLVIEHFKQYNSGIHRGTHCNTF